MARSAPPRHVYFASCNPGAEAALFEEMKRHRFARAESQRGGARFEGSADEGWRAVLTLATAVRVYREVGRFPAADRDALHRGVAELPWETILRPGQTFAVDADVKHPTLSHSGFAALVVKDGVCDRMRERCGSRPDVDPRAPDVRLFLLLRKDRAVLSLDIAGRSLHRRGYKRRGVAAPVSECLAAASLTLSGWDQKSPLLDPFCGSGTILIEGAMRASNIAPGLLSEGYAFEKLPDFDAGRWEEMRKEAREAIRLPKKLIIRGSDADPDAVTAARANAEAAGVSEFVQFMVADFREFNPTKGWGATVISNPPYGVRIEEEDALVPLYREMGEVFRQRCGGYGVHLFCHGAKLVKALALKPERYWPFVHGGLDVRLYRFAIR